MTSHSEAEHFITMMNKKVAELAHDAHEVLVCEGCSSYVKTIYIGYDIGGEMVAALYPHTAHVEVALALEEDRVGPILVDASHLTWRTLPVAAELSKAGDLAEFEVLATEACDRVRNAEHTVMRENEFFVQRRARRIRS